LQNLTASLNDSKWSGTGGRILAPEDFKPPRWLAVDGPYGFGAMLCAHFDLGEQAMELDRAPYGTNMALKRAMFEKYGGFRTDLGPRPGSEMRNEDTEFARRLFAGGERLRYEPAAIVRHAVPEKRVNKEFLLDWEFEYGKGKMREAGRKPEIHGIPRYWFSIPKGVAKILLLTLRWLAAVNPQRRFFLKASVWYMAGEVTETFAQARRNDSPTVAAIS
jgi:GT2 family glycosyltransferase